MPKKNVRAAIEIACQHKTQALLYKAPSFSHAMSGLVLNLTFFAEDANGVGDTVYIFLLPYLYLSEGLESVLAVRMWDIALYSITLTTYS